MFHFILQEHIRFPAGRNTIRRDMSFQESLLKFSLDAIFQKSIYPKNRCFAYNCLHSRMFSNIYTRYIQEVGKCICLKTPNKNIFLWRGRGSNKSGRNGIQCKPVALYPSPWNWVASGLNNYISDNWRGFCKISLAN